MGSSGMESTSSDLELGCEWYHLVSVVLNSVV